MENLCPHPVKIGPAASLNGEIPGLSRQLMSLPYDDFRDRLLKDRSLSVLRGVILLLGWVMRWVKGRSWWIGGICCMSYVNVCLHLAVCLFVCLLVCLFVCLFGEITVEFVETGCIADL